MTEDDANPDQIDPRVVQAIRDLEDEQYEASTSFPQPHFRTNLARRHRFDAVNRPLDAREAERLTQAEREEELEFYRRRQDDQDADARMVLMALWAGIMLLVFFGLLVWALFFHNPG
jgi:hypothetical protein